MLSAWLMGAIESARNAGDRGKRNAAPWTYAHEYR